MHFFSSFPLKYMNYLPRLKWRKKLDSIVHLGLFRCWSKNSTEGLIFIFVSELIRKSLMSFFRAFEKPQDSFSILFFLNDNIESISCIVQKLLISKFLLKFLQPISNRAWMIYDRYQFPIQAILYNFSMILSWYK